MLVNEAASMLASPRAIRQRTELAAKAISAARVRKAVFKKCALGVVFCII